MKQNQKETLLSSFIISHFSYCLLIWISCSKKNLLKDKCCSWKIFRDYSKWLQVSLPLIIRGSTSNNVSPTMYCKSLKCNLLSLVLYLNFVICCYCFLNFIIVAAAASTTTKDHIWSPGVSVTSISRYLLVFYKLFLWVNFK